MFARKIPAEWWRGLHLPSVERLRANFWRRSWPVIGSGEGGGRATALKWHVAVSSSSPLVQAAAWLGDA